MRVMQHSESDGIGAKTKGKSMSTLRASEANTTRLFWPVNRKNVLIKELQHY